MIGTILRSRYKIIQSLGGGGFGDTYIAEDGDLLSSRCVIKRLKPDVIDPDIIRLFNQEAQILLNLGKNHDQIPALQGYFQENNDFYLIQDLIIGQDLSKEILPNRKLSESYVIKFLQDVLNVLSFVHNNNVIHRDIKPQNIIRRQSDGKLFLIDFGAVKQVKQQTMLKSGLTSKTIAIGTPGYMPSEQAIGRPKLSSDVYALGMTAIQALTGKYPHELPVDNYDEIIWRNLVNVSDNLAGILTQMVRFRSGDRYQNAGEVLQALNQAFAPNPVSPPRHIPTTIPSPPQQIPVPNPAPAPHNIRLQTPRADYTKFDQLLAANKWEEADRECWNIMYNIMNGRTGVEDFKNFPKDELRILDNLWVKYSQGRFGFSVQKQIWIECGGTPGVYNEDVWKKFIEKTGWAQGGKWVDYNLTLNKKTNRYDIPYAFLPAGNRIVGGGGVWGMLSLFSSLTYSL
ncbi:MAG TPA: serine/threonine-protein kinase [Allocoleopsis sp.]